MRADRLEHVRAAIDGGETARAILTLCSQLLSDPKDEQAWLTLAQLVEQREQVIFCLQRVLYLNPDNQSASRALAVLQRERLVLKEPRFSRHAAISRDIQAVQASKSHIGELREHVGKGDEFAAREIKLSTYRRRSPPNWPLVIGGLLVFLVFLVGIFGPQLAPHDPLESTLIMKVGDRYLLSPFPLFAPGYPLGSDRNGRDLLSRILWAIRPTMIMVLIVASLRLVLGTLIGMIAGWSQRWPGRVLDSTIAAAISIPVIIVALGGIAAVGVDLGIWAFIIALCLTGWVETARVVREQTSLIRGQVYIEAAHALGGSNTWILRRHVLRQVLSLLWMLFAFEISGTLMLVAALGFLGYYVGGDIWVAVTDATAEAISGMPELGQMLATTETSIIRPWPLIVIGACVFVIVLAFNLLGEGFRQRVSFSGNQRGSLLTTWSARLNFWAEQNLWWPLSNLSRRRGFRLGTIGFLLLVITIPLILWQAPMLLGRKQHLISAFPQNHQWSSTRHDPYGTLWSQTTGPSEAQIQWTFTDESGFTGGPAVAGDGTLYIAANRGVLYAINPDGRQIWKTSLPAHPVGSPAIGEAGKIIVADNVGGVTALDEKGVIGWNYQPSKITPATTGPVVDPVGTIYYVQGRRLQAVTAEGDELWQVHPGGDASPSETLRLSPEGDFIFWGEILVSAKDGSSISWGELQDVDRNFTGANGKVYQVDEHTISPWEDFPAENRTSKVVTWEHDKYTIGRTSKDAGVTPDGTIWLFYSGFARSWGFGEDTRIVWLNKDGSSRGIAFYEIRNSQVIAVDQKATIYSCGNLDFGYGAPECQAFSPQFERPVWKVTLEGSKEAAGGALVSGRLYVASHEGILYAIGSVGKMASAGVSDQPALSGKNDVLEMAGEPMGPKSPASQEFFTNPSGFSGGPVMGASGLVHIISTDGILYTFDPDGEIVWQVSLPDSGIGSPAIGAQGQVYAVDRGGGLSSFSPQGKFNWYFSSGSILQGISGPVIDQAGDIFYTVIVPGRGSIQAVSAEGESLWRSEVGTDLYFRSPEISSRGDLIFFGDEIYDAQDGSFVETNLQFSVDRFFGGKDGLDYLLAGGTLTTFEVTSSGVRVSDEKVISPRGSPHLAGVTSAGMVWMFYADEIYWFSKDGKALGVSNTGGRWVDFVAGVDRDSTIYACGRNRSHRGEFQLTCVALSPDSVDPVWEIEVSTGWQMLVGSLLVPGHIYISTEDGQLYLITESQ